MWFLLAAGSAVCDSLKDLLAKKSTVQVDEYIIIFQQRLFSLIILVPLMFLNIPTHLDSQIWLPIAVVITFDTLASIFYIKALKISPISLVSPIASLTPVAILLSSLLINKELPTLGGILGVLLAAVGIYVLRFSKRSAGLLEPFLSLGREPGTRLMLGVVLLWSITSSFDKTVVQLTNAFFYTGFVSIGYTIVIFLIVLARRHSVQEIFKHTGRLVPIGLAQGSSLLLQMIALPLTFVSYVIAIKLSSGMISVWSGKIFFKEEHFLERIIGTAIILTGIGLMIFNK